MAAISEYHLRVTDNNGVPISGGKRGWFQNRTTTPVTTYSDAALTTAQAHPLVANGDGRLQQPFIATGTYTIRTYDASDVLLHEEHDVTIEATLNNPFFFTDEAALVASTDPFEEGDYIITLAEQAFYKVAASSATDHDLTTTGGEKIYRQDQDYDTVANFLNSDEGSRGEGQKWSAGGYDYIEAASDATDHHVTNNAGVKFYVSPGEKRYSVMALGTLGDGTTDDRAAIEAATTLGGDVFIPPGEYKVEGQIDTSSDLALRMSPGAVIKPAKRSDTGSILTNVTGDSVTRNQENIVIENLQMDGTDYPDPVYTTVSSATSTTVTLASGSTTDNAYTGDFIQALDGDEQAQFREITAYVGSTRTATLASAFDTTLVSGVGLVIGSNDNAQGYARETKSLQFIGGFVENFPMEKQVPAARGGKATNLDTGIQGASGTLPNSKNVFAHFFVQGRDGSSGGSPLAATNIAIGNLGHSENCGAFISIINGDGAAGISDDFDEMSVVASNGTYKNAGHAPWRIVSGNQQKSGIINLGGANGVKISNIIGYNEAAYPNSSPGYPTDYASRCGFGLSGNVGALIWGHARNSSVNNVQHGGNLDAVVMVGRNRAVGDDASPGTVTEAFNWNLSDIVVNGTVTNIVSRDPVLTPDGDQVSGHWQITVDECTGDIVPGAWTNADLLTLDVTEVSSGKRIIGTAADIVRAGNDFDSFQSGTTDVRRNFEVTIPAQSVVQITPPEPNGHLNITPSVKVSGSSGQIGMLGYRTFGASEVQLSGAGAALVATTGVLAYDGGDTANEITLSPHTDEDIYIKNTYTVDLTLNLAFF